MVDYPLFDKGHFEEDGPATKRVGSFRAISRRDAVMGRVESWFLATCKRGGGLMAGHTRWLDKQCMPVAWLHMVLEVAE